MRFNTKATTVFLDPNSLVSYDKNDVKKVNVILSPSLYWVKKVSLPVKYIRDALKLLPSIFEDILPPANYSYSAYKSGEEFFIFAYEDKYIIDTLAKVGINLSDVSNIYFAQSELDSIDTALKINEMQSVYVKDDIVVLLPCCWIQESGELDLDGLKLSKHTIKLKQYGHLVDNSSFYKISAVLVVLSVLIFAQYFITMQKVSKLQQMRTDVFRKYNLKSTMLQNKSVLKKYKKTHLEQTKIREYISYILSFKLKSKEKLSKINLKDDVIKAEFIGVNSSTLNRLKNFLKSKKLNFKADMRNSKVYLEIVL
jgi:hypothetical protein